MASFEFEEAARADLEQLHYMSVRLEQAKKRLCLRIEHTIDEEEEADPLNEQLMDDIFKIYKKADEVIQMGIFYLVIQIDHVIRPVGGFNDFSLMEHNDFPSSMCLISPS